MKKTIPIALLLILFGCKKEEQVIKPIIPQAEEAIASKECYAGINNKDSIFLSIDCQGNEVTDGKLSYKIFEKDRNEGQLVGTVKGDTLFATYTFTSEGAVSVREVVFLKKGSNYVEGYGEIVDDNSGNITFKDIHNLKFDSTNVLKKTACD